jgi:hypothetical protein
MRILTESRLALERGRTLAGAATDFEPVSCRSHNPGWRG